MLSPRSSLPRFLLESEEAARTLPSIERTAGSDERGKMPVAPWEKRKAKGARP
jgi:hypothetical protein